MMERCQTCLNKIEYCNCEPRKPSWWVEPRKPSWWVSAISTEAAPLTYEALEAAWYGTPESRHPSSAHLYAVPDLDDEGDSDG